MTESEVTGSPDPMYGGGILELCTTPRSVKNSKQGCTEYYLVTIAQRYYLYSWAEYSATLGGRYMSPHCWQLQAQRHLATQGFVQDYRNRAHVLPNTLLLRTPVYRTLLYSGLFPHIPFFPFLSFFLTGSDISQAGIRFSV